MRVTTAVVRHNDWSIQDRGPTCIKHHTRTEFDLYAFKREIYA